MSLYSHKNSGVGAVQPWSQAVTLAEAGKGCDGLFSLYDSLGDKTLVGANTISTLLDGPEKVVRYGALTLGDGTTPTSLTAANRCKGLTILCDSLTVKANATLHMTGRGARVLTNDDPFFPFVDYKIPFKISLDSSRMSLAQALAVIKASGFAPWDIGTFQAVITTMFGFNCAVSLAGGLALMLATGGGLGGVGLNGVATPTPGNNGGAGTGGGMGGGGSGGSNWTTANIYSPPAGMGCPYSGGSATAGQCCESTNTSQAPLQSQFSGRGGKPWVMWGVSGKRIYVDDDIKVENFTKGGGGAGNPGGKGGTTLGSDGGNGCGGKLTIICRGTITVQSGGKIEANGMPGGDANGYGGGGGSGGGHISIITPSSGNLVNSGTVQAIGGLGGDQSYANFKGGSGGAGSVVTKTFSDMGW